MPCKLIKLKGINIQIALNWAHFGAIFQIHMELVRHEQEKKGPASDFWLMKPYQCNRLLFKLEKQESFRLFLLKSL